MAFQNSASRIYLDVDPPCELVVGEDTNTLKVEVPGFKKEELKAHVYTSKNLKISGERNVDRNQWCRFQKTFQLPDTCDISKITAKFDNGYLYVMVPKAPALDSTPSQDGNTTPNTNTMPSNEEQPNKIAGGLLRAREPERPGIVSKVLDVILNIVITAMVLVHVLRRLFGGRKIQQHTN